MPGRYPVGAEIFGIAAAAEHIVSLGGQPVDAFDKIVLQQVICIKHQKTIKVVETL